MLLLVVRTIEDCHWCTEVERFLERSRDFAVNAKLIGTKKKKKKKKEILAKYLEMVQTHYTEPPSDEDVIMGSFMAISVNEDANTVKTAPNVPVKEEKTNH